MIDVQRQYIERLKERLREAENLLRDAMKSGLPLVLENKVRKFLGILPREEKRG